MKRKEEPDPRFSLVLDAILNKEDPSDIIHPDTSKGSIVNQARIMTTLKPADIAPNDMDYLLKNDSNRNFCSMAIYRVENFNASACKIAMVKVVDGQVVKEYETNFRPIKLTKKIQKILGNDKVNEIMSYPEFLEIWHEASDFLESQTIITYDMGYESAVLSTFFDNYEISFKPLTFMFAISKTQKKIKKLAEELSTIIEEQDCMTLARIVTQIELNDSLERDDLAMIKKKMYHNL